ncbi:MAG: MFS transporter [Syntrophobacteraceae bacterium]
MNSAPSNGNRSIRNIGRAFGSRNYRLFFIGQSISLVGTWMQQTALAWLVYRLTGSAFLLGLVGFVSQVPSLVVAPFAGVLIDRWNRHRVLVVTQCLAALQASLLAFLVLIHDITIERILVLSLFLGVVNSFDMPNRQSFVVQMVEDRKLLGNAIALNSSMVHIARMIGPPIAGVLIALFGEGVCFLVNAVSYVAVILCVLKMTITPQPYVSHDKRVLASLKEGFSYAFAFAPIRSLILLLSFTSLMGMPFVVLMPLYAKDIFHGTSQTLGLLMGATGMGALSGALFLASRSSVLGLGRILVIASSTLGVGVMAFSHSTLLPLSLLMLFCSGFGMMVLLTSSNSILQTIVDEEKRGRVMSLYTMAFMGTVPFGNLLHGSLASRFGPQNTLLLGGLCCLVGAILFARQLPALRKLVRPIYVRLGILPE